jgi:hypothetical protein
VSRPRVVAQGPAELFAGSAYDPTAAAGLVAWQRPNGVALMLRGSTPDGLPGTRPALGGGRIAWREGDTIVVAAAATLERRERHDAPGAEVLAVSESLVAWRTRDPYGTDRIWTATAGDPPRTLLEQPAPQELGRPALAGSRLLTHVAGPLGSHLLSVDVASGAQQILRAEPGAQLSNPSTADGTGAAGSLMLYVHATGRAQELRIGTLEPLEPAYDEIVLVHASSGRRDREHERGRKRHRHQGRRPALPPRAAPGVVDTLWTTALTNDSAFVTRLHVQRGRPRTADILRVPIAA